jgi:hypothetical protein
MKLVVAVRKQYGTGNERLKNNHCDTMKLKEVLQLSETVFTASL